MSTVTTRAIEIFLEFDVYHQIRCDSSWRELSQEKNLYLSRSWNLVVVVYRAPCSSF